MMAHLYSIIDDHLDSKEIEQILLNLEKDYHRFNQANEKKNDLSDDLTLIEKINPFSERDKKGDILKVKVEMEDIASIYNDDISIIKEKASVAISGIPAFQFKFQMIALNKSIKDISASGPQGAWVSGKEKAQAKSKAVDKLLAEQFGVEYQSCPPHSQLVKGYLAYLLEPYHLPNKLKS